jgi:hypothetical protein
MIRTEATAEGKSPEAPGLKTCRTTGNARCAAPAKKCLTRWADETGLTGGGKKIDLNLPSERYKKIWTLIWTKTISGLEIMALPTTNQ